MPQLQRYVSSELTHFVGRNCQDDESQYELLKTILSSGQLKSRSSPPIPNAFSMRISGSGSFSKNNVYESEVVCFCDIPVEDFEIHMQKYSRFGLSFQKSFLVRKDANPVFYIATDSVDLYPSVHSRRLEKPEITRADSFDAFFETYKTVFNKLIPWIVADPHRERIPAELVEVLEEIWHLPSFLHGLLSYLKFFESKAEEISRSNYYMEREWRIRGSLEFQLDNVSRIVLPATYARRFRRDVPDFFGQITFSDQASACRR